MLASQQVDTQPLVGAGPGLDNILRTRITGCITAFTDALYSGDTAAAAFALTSLIGLGHGLTPSGDDIVCGVVAALLWQSHIGAIHHNVMQPIMSAVLDATPRTNRISARLLHHACDGILYAPAMELGSALLAGDSDGIALPAARLFTIGNSTGADLATGLLIGCALKTETRFRGSLLRGRGSISY
jgi:hypothetical protein